MSSILKIIQDLRGSNSSNYKKEVLIREKDNELFKSVLLATLDPTTNYYIRKIPEYNTPEENYGRPLSWALSQLKSNLSTRLFTGNAASAELKDILQNITADDAEVIKLVIGGDLKCGVGITLTNKVFANLIPETPYQRCSSLKAMKNANWEDGIISDLKSDGSFVYVHKDVESNIKLFTRSGTMYDTELFTKLNDDFDKLVPGFVYMGEFLVLQDGILLNRQTGNGILNSVSSGTPFGDDQQPRIDLWDAIPEEFFKPKGEYKSPYKLRRLWLHKVLTMTTFIKPIESKIVYSMAEAMEHYREIIERGLEGTILKFLESPWADGTSRMQFKLKIEADVELEIVGFTKGNNKNALLFGSLMCKSSCGEIEVNVSGMKDAVRKLIHENREEYIGRIITVRFNSMVTPRNGKTSLFLPRYIETRNDKSVADSKEQIQAIYDSLVNL